MFSVDNLGFHAMQKLLNTNKLAYIRFETQYLQLDQNPLKSVKLYVKGTRSHYYPNCA